MGDSFCNLRRTPGSIADPGGGGGVRGVKPPFRGWFFFCLSVYEIPTDLDPNPPPPPSKNSGPEPPPPFKEFLDPPLPGIDMGHSFFDANKSIQEREQWQAGVRNLQVIKPMGFCLARRPAVSMHSVP